MSKWIPIHEYEYDRHGKAVVCARLHGDALTYWVGDPRGLDGAWSGWTHFMPIPPGPTHEDVLQAENDRLRKRIAELEASPVKADPERVKLRWVGDDLKRGDEVAAVVRQFTAGYYAVIMLPCKNMYPGGCGTLEWAKALAEEEVLKLIPGAVVMREDEE